MWGLYTCWNVSALAARRRWLWTRHLTSFACLSEWEHHQRQSRGHHDPWCLNFLWFDLSGPRELKNWVFPAAMLFCGHRLEGRREEPAGGYVLGPPNKASHEIQLGSPPAFMLVLFAFYSWHYQGPERLSPCPGSHSWTVREWILSPGFSKSQCPWLCYFCLSGRGRRITYKTFKEISFVFWGWVFLL